jgi:hypothetical protein
MEPTIILSLRDSCHLLDDGASGTAARRGRELMTLNRILPVVPGVV